MESTDIGTRTEAKVADYIRKNTSAKITGYSNKITTSQKIPLGDIDVATESQWIEVKASVSAVKTSQIEKYATFLNEKYINVNNKEVILYIDEPIDTTVEVDMKKLELIEEMGVTIVNGLEELGKVVK